MSYYSGFLAEFMEEFEGEGGLGPSMTFDISTENFVICQRRIFSNDNLDKFWPIIKNN